AQGFGVIFDCDFERLLAAQNAMAPRGVAALEFANLEGDHAVVEQRDDPAQGTDEAHAVLAGPVHGFGEVDPFGDDGGQLFAQGIREQLPFRELVKDIALAFGVCDLVELINARGPLAGESFGGLRSCGEVGTGYDGLDVGRLFQQIFDEEHEAARCGVEHQRFAAECAESRFETAFQVLESGFDHPVGDFFSADFEEEGGHQASTSVETAPSRSRLGSPCCCCCSTQAWATPTASFLTRAMIPTRSVTLIAPRASSRLKMCEHLSARS